MAITWRQHVKATMSRMGKATHLKDALKEASRTWSSVKKDAGAVVSAVEGKTKRRRGRSGRKAAKGKKQTRRAKSRKGSRRGRRGGRAFIESYNAGTGVAANAENFTDRG
jgi:hypothetical protein